MGQETDFEKATKELIRAMGNFVQEFVIAFSKLIQPIIDGCINNIEYIANKNKITKKRFIKLLRSQGVHRDKINELIKNNKQPYTYTRFIETINLLKKEE